MILIAIVNESTVISDDDISGGSPGYKAGAAGVLEALRTQLARDFCPAWNIAPVNLLFAAKGQALPDTAWVLTVLDDSDQADALGYHDETATGMPLGKVFAKTCLNDRVSWSVCMSHELLEMLADPWINLCAEGADGQVRAYEVCDAVEDDSLGYEIDGVLVSDFVTPAWFSMQPKVIGPFDYGRKCNAPFELARGGYISIMQAGNWSQVMADSKAMRKRAAQRGSRRERRVRQHKLRRASFASGVGVDSDLD